MSDEITGAENTGGQFEPDPAAAFKTRRVEASEQFVFRGPAQGSRTETGTNTELPSGDQTDSLSGVGGGQEERTEGGGAAGLPIENLRSLGVLSPADVDRICDGEKHTRFLVDDFLPAKCIAIAAGESTIGKSPLIYQLGLCVAAGIPFLGMPTKKRRVLYLDLENSLLDHQQMRDALTGFLGIGTAPADFLVVPQANVQLDLLLEAAKPALVVVDSLRAYRPEVTEKNATAGQFLKEIRDLARKHDCAILIVHHIRKPTVSSVICDLDDETRVQNWMLEMEGPRALVNQTDVRIAIAEDNGHPAALKVKWSRRVHGDSPLVLLDRVLDDGEPQGYRPLTGADFLNPQQREALGKLPSAPGEFSFKDARQALGEPDNRTNEFLKKCKRHGLVKKIAKNRYGKLDSAGNGGVDGVST